MIFDLHVHTAKGSPDSSLTPSQLISEAKRIRLDGVCVTEHGRVWNKYDVETLNGQHDILIIRGMEVDTDLGHILVFGLDNYVSGIHRATDLRRVISEIGGFMIAVHPFRRAFDKPIPSFGQRFSPPPSLKEATNMDLFQLVDEIEVVNGACSDRENFFALQVAKKLGWRGTGGSDAHSTHGLGCFATVFEREIRSEVEFIAELKAGRFYPAEGLLDGELAAYGDGVTEFDLEPRP